MRFQIDLLKHVNIIFGACISSTGRLTRQHIMYIWAMAESHTRLHSATILSHFTTIFNPPVKFSSSEEWPNWKQRSAHFRTPTALNREAVHVQVCSLIYVMGSDAEKIFSSFEFDVKVYTGQIFQSLSPKNLSRAHPQYNNYCPTHAPMPLTVIPLPPTKILQLTKISNRNN